jgi:RNA recognition motif-containing protein
VFNKALVSSFEDSTAYLTLWSTYADYMRRSQLDWQAVYQEGVNWLQDYVSPLHLSLKVHRAQVEEKETAVQLFEEVVKEKGDSYALWRAYLNYMEKTSDCSSTRHIYRRAVEYTKDYPADICREWLNWEDTCNTPTELIAARLKVFKRLKRQQVLPVKRQREETKKVSRDDQRHTAYVGGVPKIVKDNDLQEFFGQLAKVKDCRIVRSVKGESKGFAYVDCRTEEELEEFIRKYDGRDLQGSVLHVTKSKPPAKAGRDAFTVFLNNLPYGVTEDDIRKLLSRYGEIQEIRIIRNANGQCRGYAYAEFRTEEGASAAVSLGRAQLGGREILLKGAQSDQQEKNVIYVANLPFSATEATVKTLFPGATSVRMPVDLSGQSKGFAFIEFTSTSLADALLAADPLEVEGRTLVLKRSSKPKKAKLANSDFAKFL